MIKHTKFSLYILMRVEAEIKRQRLVKYLAKKK